MLADRPFMTKRLPSTRLVMHDGSKPRLSARKLNMKPALPGRKRKTSMPSSARSRESKPSAEPKSARKDRRQKRRSAKSNKPRLMPLPRKEKPGMMLLPPKLLHAKLRLRPEMPRDVRASLNQRVEEEPGDLAGDLAVPPPMTVVVVVEEPGDLADPAVPPVVPPVVLVAVPGNPEACVVVMTAAAVQTVGLDGHLVGTVTIVLGDQVVGTVTLVSEVHPVEIVILVSDGLVVEVEIVTLALDPAAMEEMIALDLATTTVIALDPATMIAVPAALECAATEILETAIVKAAGAGRRVVDGAATMPCRAPPTTVVVVMIVALAVVVTVTIVMLVTLQMTVKVLLNHSHKANTLLEEVQLQISPRQMTMVLLKYNLGDAGGSLGVKS